MPSTKNWKKSNASNAVAPWIKKTDTLAQPESRSTESAKDTTTTKVPGKLRKNLRTPAPKGAGIDYKNWDPSRPTIRVYTDGSGTSDGPIGWAFLVTDLEEHTVLYEGSGSQADGTNNIAELLGIIRGLQYCKTRFRDVNIQVYSDSQYALNGYQKKWIEQWRDNGWRSSKGKPVANKEYWLELVLAVGCLRVTWHHCPGHAGIKFNERCDVLANQARLSYKEEKLCLI